MGQATQSIYPKFSHSKGEHYDARGTVLTVLNLSYKVTCEIECDNMTILYFCALKECKFYDVITLFIYTLIRYTFKGNNISTVHKNIARWQFQATNTIVLDIKIRH